MAVAAASDALAPRLERPAARAVARLGAAVAVLSIARGAGVTWTDLGLGRGSLRAGALAGLAAGAGVAAAVFAAAATPATRGLLRDERALMAGDHGRMRAELARIALVTVPPEELVYRSGLLGMRLVNGSPASAIGWPSALFGLSHIWPTLATIRHSPLGRRLADRPLRQAAFVAGNVAVTSLGGAGFAWLRLRTGSLLAPLVAHIVLNTSALLAGRVSHRLT